MLNTIAVYGTLRRGMGNHRFLRDAEYLGIGDTVSRFRLCVNGLPYLLRGAGLGEFVELEVYRVDQKTFREVDRLEGHPHFYRRMKLPVIMRDNEQEPRVVPWIYTVGEQFDDGVYHSSYTKAMRDSWIPR